MADADAKPYWGDEFRPFVRAWREDDEPETDSSPPTLSELADAIVRGASVCHAIVPELRHLIDAVQKHPDARLAKRGPDGKPTIDDPTQVVIRGGEMTSCQCGKHSTGKPCVIGVALNARTHFTGNADFEGVTFTGEASFFKATFTREAHCIDDRDQPASRLPFGYVSGWPPAAASAT